MKRCVITILLLSGIGLAGSAEKPATPAEVPDPGDPNACPWQIVRLVEALYPPDPNLEASIARFLNTSEHPSGQKTPAAYWETAYHPQVNATIYELIDYLYFPGGSDYAAGLQVASASQAPDSAAPDEGLPPAVTGFEKQQSLDVVYDLIHQWRQVNESAGTSLEILRTTELTHTKTGVYQHHADLAVRTKRTLGHLRTANRRFDQLSRMTVALTLRGEEVGALVSRLKKQLSDIQALLGLLADQNDQLRVALGLGPFDRSQPAATHREPVDFSKERLPKQPY